MTIDGNATVDEIVYDDHLAYELIYIAVTLFIGSLTALLLGLRRRHDPTSPSSVHGTGCGSHELRQDPVCV